MLIPLLLLLVLLLSTTANAFSIQQATRQGSFLFTTLSPSYSRHASRPILTTRFAGTDDNTSRRKKRVKRKTEAAVEEMDDTVTAKPPVVVEKKEDEKVPPPAPPQQTIQPRKESVVQMQVMDVRDLVPGGSGPSRTVPTTTSTAQTAKATAVSNFIRDDGDDDDDDVDLNDPMARLLADAKQMRVQEQENASESDKTPDGAVMTAVKKVISTIVTIDFFVVIALFLWFMGGIFCSYGLKDDAVQIAFNNIFEPVVRPALGVLMIASISDAVLRDDDGK